MDRALVHRGWNTGPYSILYVLLYFFKLRTLTASFPSCLTLINPI
jgi:hypothetical protein